MKRVLIIIAGVVIFLHSFKPVSALCVAVDKANVRVGPGTSYEVVWEVFRYMPFLKVGISNSGTWYAVKDVDGDVNWIHKDLVTGKCRCAVVKASAVNVRSGPGTRYSAVCTATKYYTFKVIGRKGGWLKLVDEKGDQGWIHRDLLWVQ
jgi:SH3-like domain-containing protein